jgi:hypothetical protein
LPPESFGIIHIELRALVLTLLLIEAVSNSQKKYCPIFKSAEKRAAGMCRANNRKIILFIK